MRDSVLGRVARILDLFDDSASRLRLTGIARRTGLPLSTVHRLVEAMIGLDWLRRTPDGLALGPRASRLVGEASAPHLELRAAAVPHLLALNRRTGLAVDLAVLDGPMALHLDSIGTWGEGHPAPPAAGTRVPAYRCALGRALLSTVPIDEVDELLPPAGGRGPHPVALRTEIDAVRRRGGVAFDIGRSVPGIATIAAATGPSGSSAAISLSGPATVVQAADLVPLLLETALRIPGRPADGRGVASGQAAAAEVAARREQMLALLRMLQHDDWV